MRAWLVSRWLLMRVWVLSTNDGIIATASLLQGFAGAGADNLLLITAAMAAAIAGALGVGGAKWAESAGERDAQLATAEAEAERLRTQPEGEHAQLVAHYVGRGLTVELAEQVADQLEAADPLAAQLDTEHNIDEIPPAIRPVLEGLRAAAAFAIGASIPVAITVLTPFQLDTVALFVAAGVSLAITSVLAARSAHLSTSRMLMRTLVVGLGTMAVSFVAGVAILPEAD
ncbi:VIT1/CCC1 family predicted Fe2+/Mn2+ transporter [Humibacillus xanthopallidus]|uniref:VIT1/CCC1 family predicted Fe2+/Mn2+ transporter n=1 Tax=Humibacillus xanthopallidus TaxID=412689 RepID=A0A543PQ50_9MICO|nr:VIT1/CCC1 transporter family protein [Humibacillus xanthopallidus]TQN46206.1 VIT1/CCC1 family predicted Fe2+/Mn2+ transporter [Humibacillus xanthopallidus]